MKILSGIDVRALKGVASVLIVVSIFLLLANCTIPVNAGTYEAEWVYKVEEYGVTKEILATLNVTYSAPDSIEEYDLIPVTVVMEYVNDSHAKMEYVVLRDICLSLRAKEGLKSGAQGDICSDDHSPYAELYRGDKYNHTFYVEATRQGEYYLVLRFSDRWSDGEEFTQDTGMEDPEGISSNMLITIGPPKDTDGDGVYDPYESRMGLDPISSDTDGDGTPDGKEDADGDALTNGEECKRYFTDPTKADTDGDGLQDGEEILGGITDPHKYDTDGD